MQTSNTVLPNLSPRLSLLASLVPKGAKVCDVGTDHGLLPAYLYLKGEVKSVCATDINAAPLERAQKAVARYNAEGFRLVLCDGLEKITKDDADTVIIAGMGGEVISGIIERCDFLNDSAVTLILQPMTGADALRSHLAKSGFDILEEPCVCEHGKVWSVIKARFDGIVRDTDPLGLLIGRVSPETDAGRAYIKKQYERCLKCYQNLEAGREKHIERAAYWRELTQKLKRILED